MCQELKSVTFHRSAIDRAERHDFWSRFLPFILLFFSRVFLGGKRKGEKNNQSRGQKLCLSARSRNHMILERGGHVLIMCKRSRKLFLLQRIWIFELLRVKVKYLLINQLRGWIAKWTNFKPTELWIKRKLSEKYK